MKRFLTTLLCILMVVGIMPMIPGANGVANADTDGWQTFGTDCRYKIETTGEGESQEVTLTIAPAEGKDSGTLPDDVHLSNEWPWSGQKATVTKVAIDGKIKSGKSLNGMFYDFKNLTEIVGLSNLDTSNAIKAVAMFCGCKKMEFFDLSGFDTSNVTDMAAMFRLCNSLQNIEFPSTFVTSKVVTMEQMFEGCEKLETVDLSGFDTHVTTNMKYMFRDCGSLKTIFVSDMFVTLNVIESNHMFWGCESIEGGSGTENTVSYLDKTCAHIDGGKENPGFFTLAEPLCFMADIAGSTVTLGKIGSPSWAGYYRIGTDWVEYIPGTTGAITLENRGDKVYFKGKYTGENSSDRYLNFSMTGSIAASGNVMSLCTENRYATENRIPYDYCFYSLFKDCTSLTMAPELPATVLTSSCYHNMFYGCTSLSEVPELPATTLSNDCYNNMFFGCTSLVISSVARGIEWCIPTETTTASDWNNKMFDECTNVDLGSGSKTPVLNTTYYIASSPVCKIGEKTYLSIENALADESESSPTNIKLIADDTENITIPNGKNVIFDLNGHVLKGNGTGSVITNNGTLTIVDKTSSKARYYTVGTDELWTLNDRNKTDAEKYNDILSRPEADKIIAVKGGCITGGKGTVIDEKAYGGAIYNTGIININSGNIIGNKAYSTENAYGGGIYNSKDGTLNVSGGNIAGNITSNNGGGIHNLGTLKISEDAIISCNTAASGRGGAIMSESVGESSFILIGGKITYNLAENSGGIETKRIIVGGSARVEDNSKKSGEKEETNNLTVPKNLITIGTDDMTPGYKMSIGITVSGTPTYETPISITENDGNDYSKYFVSDNLIYKVEYVPKALAHLVVIPYTLTAITASTTSIILDKDFPLYHAIAIAKAQKPYTELQKETVIAYKLSKKVRYSTIMATSESDWQSCGAITLDAMQADSTKDYFVIGTVTKQAHDFTYTASSENKTITATCNSATCDLTDKKVVVTLVTSDEDYTGEAYTGASINGKTAWDKEGTAQISLKYVGRAGTSYTESTTAPTAVGKYTVTMTASDKSVSKDFEITPKQLTVSGTTVESTKTYDGKTTATVTANGTLAGKIESESVSLDKVTAEYDNKNVGTGKSITVKYTITGTNASNYKAPIDNTSLKASISQKDISVLGTSVAPSKTYDGTIDATVTAGTLNEVVNGDTVTLEASAEYEDKNVGEGKDVTVNYSISGTDADNYNLAQDSETLSADITKRSVTLTSASASKQYDGTALTDSEVTESDEGWAEGEGATYDVTGSQTEVGNSKNTFTYSLKDGTTETNYNITKVEGTLTITKKAMPVYYNLAQKPTVTKDNGANTTLSSDGTRLTVTVQEGYELVEVKVNGVSKGAVTELTGLKTGDKVEVVTKKKEEVKQITAKQIKTVAESIEGKASSKYVTKNGKQVVQVKCNILEGKAELQKLVADGCRVEYVFYRSTKKASNYKKMYVSKTGKYTNTKGTVGQRYFYKSIVKIYNQNNELVAITALKDCKYATRIFK